MNYCRDMFRLAAATILFASFFRVHFFLFNTMKQIKLLGQQGKSVQESSIVHYENLTTPTFTVNIGYRWGEPPGRSSKTDPTNNFREATRDGINSNQTTNESSGSTMNVKKDDEHSNIAKVEIRPSLSWDQAMKRRIEASYMTTDDDNQKQFVVVGGDLVGTIQNGRLSVEVNETYAFWNNGQSRLCRLLRDMTLKSSLNDPTPATNTSIVLPRPLLNLTIDCEQISKREDFGQGNWITALYSVRMAVALAKVDYQFQCTTARDSQMTLLLPWFDGYHPAPSEEDPWPYDAEVPTEKEVCGDKYRSIRVDKMSHEIQKDIRRMAIDLVGPPKDDKTLVMIDRKPLIANVTLDDVAIHFRCGDVMGGVRRGDFGMIKFNEYPKWIRNDIRSIGILTQPFDKSITRGRDKGHTDACRQAVYLLVNYLQTFYPEATITIRNSYEETFPLAYARIAMAKQSFTSLSSFGIFPVVGTFGEGYFQKGNPGVNPFASFVPSYLPNLHEMRAPVKSSAQIQQMGLNATLAWFVSDDDDDERVQLHHHSDGTGTY